MHLHVPGLIFFLFAYGIGCFNTGYYLVRLMRRQDVRDQGSGATGATNVSRELGRSGFVLTFIGDFLKGAAVVIAAQHFDIPEGWTLAALVAVVAGHIWPVQLHFRGGKGVATTLGILAFYDLRFLLALAIIFILLYGMTRYYTLSGLSAFVLAAFVPWFLGYPVAASLVFVGIIALITWAQRDNIREVVISLQERGSG